MDTNILEVACALYCTDAHSVFECWSVWVWSHDYPPPFEEALKVNGLTHSDLRSRGVCPRHALERVKTYFGAADAIIAHNGLSFDKPILEAHCNKYGIKLPQKPWIDSRVDFEYPANMTSKRLTHLAADHGVYDPKAHKALFDVYMMLEIAKNYDLEEAFKRCQSPVIRIETSIPRTRNDEAKKFRYIWDPNKKVWWKNIREIDYEKERSQVSFSIQKEVKSGS